MRDEKVVDLDELSRPVDLLEPLLHRHHECRAAKKIIGECTPPRVTTEDMVDFGTEVTSIASPESTDTSRHSVSSSIVSQQPLRYIDNTRRTYVPIVLSSGNTVHCAPDVLSTCPMILRSIQTDLTEILKVLPWSTHALVKRTEIWVNLSYSYGTLDEPHVLRHSTAHHEEGWLLRCARDRPEKSRCIEVYSCFDFERMRLHWNGCGLLLHEFVHLIHQECLGLDHSGIKKLYTEAYKSGRYEEVLRRDWAGQDEDFDMAYAMVDPKEFFAEMSVAYLSGGYRNLDTANPTQMVDCSPPLLEPTVIARILRIKNFEDEPYHKPIRSGILGLLAPTRLVPKIRIIDPVWQEGALARNCRDIKHCNKFYPFTSGQLRHYDTVLFRAMRDIWSEIALYDDPQEDPTCCLKIAKFLPNMR